MHAMEDDYASRNFVEVLHEVIIGSLPFAALLGNATYKLRARKISAHYGKERHKDFIFHELSIRVFRSLDKLGEIKHEDEFFKWLSVVADHISIDLFRKDNKEAQDISIDQLTDKSRDRDDGRGEKHIICDTTPSPYLDYAIKEWMSKLTPFQRRIYQLYTEDPDAENRKASSRKIASKLKKEGIKCSHTTVAKEWKKIEKSCLEMLGRVGIKKRERGRSV